mgnify:CR=1 FL=1
MLEEIAYEYVNLSEGSLGALGYGLTILGAVIAGGTNRSNAELARAPYFAFSALILFLMSAIQVVWLQSLPAIAGGYLWVLMAINIMAAIISGFFFGKIAIARSRDAYGHGWMAVLAFIPLANLWLLQESSKNAVSTNRVPTIPLMTGGLGVLSGFVMLVMAVVVGVIIEEDTRRLANNAQTEDASQQAGIDFAIRSDGLEATLRMLAVEAQTPITIDEITTLEAIEATETELRRTYVVDLASFTVTDDFQARVSDGICGHDLFILLLRAGASIREDYIGTDGLAFGTVVVTEQDCEL